MAETSPTSQRPALGRLATRHGAWLTAALFAIGWFAYLGFGPTLSPTHTAWMLRDDWAAYLWGFAFFRNSEWAFPLGNTPELFYPFGTSVGFTDANPWVSMLFKLVSPWLPLDFQFAGLWFLLCFVLQAVFGTLITATMTDDRVQQALGGALFALTPLLPSRTAHVAISGFFFLSAGIYLHLRRLESREQALRLLRLALLLSIWAAGTHGYLSVMLLALVLAWVLRLGTTDKLLSLRDTALAALACVGVTVATYWLFGYIAWKGADLTAEGFGQFSGDLTALVNPQGWSRFFDKLPHRPRQWEGFLYLGTGVFFLLALGTVVVARSNAMAMKRALRRTWALALALLLLWVYSLSSKVAFLGDVVLDLEPLYAPFSSLTGIFRTSGRFAWPLHLALIAAAIAVATSFSRAWIGRALLVVAIVLQASEIKAERLDFHDVPMKPLADPAWTSVGEHYRHLRLVPIHLLWVCQYDARLVNRLSYEAYRRKLTFNSGNFMRKEAGVDKLCKKHLDPAEPLRDDTIYVVDRRYLSDFDGRDATCGALDGLSVCVSNAKTTPLREALANEPLRR